MNRAAQKMSVPERMKKVENKLFCTHRHWRQIYARQDCRTKPGCIAQKTQSWHLSLSDSGRAQNQIPFTRSFAFVSAPLLCDKSVVRGVLDRTRLVVPSSVWKGIAFAPAQNHQVELPPCPSPCCPPAQRTRIAQNRFVVETLKWKLKAIVGRVDCEKPVQIRSLLIRI